MAQVEQADKLKELDDRVWKLEQIIGKAYIAMDDMTKLLRDVAEAISVLDRHIPK